MTGRVVRRTSSMTGKPNGSADKDPNVTDTPPEEDKDKAETKDAAPPDKADKKPTRRKKRSSAKKKTKPPKITEDDLYAVGEITMIAYNGGEDPVEPQDLVDTWRARVAAWDRVHGKAAE